MFWASLVKDEEDIKYEKTNIPKNLLFLKN